jgi:L-alanine-DL-glutamate epimerase-like enolase superfamily enzyme
MSVPDDGDDPAARITRVKAAQHVKLRKNWNRTLVKVETDTGPTGYGAVGSDGDTVRGQIHQMEDLLLGADPVEIEKLYDRMMGQQHSHGPHVPTVGGVDIALWDLAGKLLDRPVSELLTGRFRETVPFYVNSRPEDLLDPESCRDWARSVLDGPTPPTAVKVSFDSVFERDAPSDQQGRERRTISSREQTAIERAATNVRTALDGEMDFIFHCHSEWDFPSALRLAEAAAPANPLWLEDPLPVEYSDSWRTLHEKAPCRILTGEKLEGVGSFEPFVRNAAVDIVQPDLVFAGGITGCRRIARLADRYHLPVTAHNTGGLVQNAATVHFAASTRNFWMTETRLTQSDWIEEMGSAPGLDLSDGRMHVPSGPGLGVTLDEDAIRDMLIDGEHRHW